MIGTILAKRVEMTSMPELVAILHSFVERLRYLLAWQASLTPHIFR